MDEKILSKVKKLLRLASSSNVNEAIAAATKAQELIEKYRITEEVLRDYVEGGKQEFINSMDLGLPLFNMGKDPVPWIAVLSSAVAKANHCRAFIAPYRTDPRQEADKVIAIAGTLSNIKLTILIFTYLITEINRLAEVFGKDKNNIWKESFRLGAAETVQKRLDETLEQIHTEGTQVAITKMFSDLDKYLESIGATNKKEKWQTVSPNGLIKGREEGKKIDLMKSPKLATENKNKKQLKD